MDIEEFGRRSTEHRKAVLSYAYLCCRDLHLAEDIVQDTMAIALEKRDQYFPEASFSGWLISIARNLWARERERRQIDARATSFLDDNATYLFDDPGYLNSTWEAETRALQDCLKKLHPTDRDLIHAHFTKKQKYADIARLMERTLSWVKVRMHRARLALLRCVELSAASEGGAP